MAFVLRYSSILCLQKVLYLFPSGTSSTGGPLQSGRSSLFVRAAREPIQSWKQKVEMPHKSEQLTGFTSSSPTAPASARGGVGLDLEDKVDKVANSPNQQGLCTPGCWLVRTTCEVTRQQKDSVTLQPLLVWQKSNHFVSTLCSPRNSSLGSLVSCY